MDKKFFNGLAVGSIVTMVATLGVVTIIRNSQVVDSGALTKFDQVTSIIERKYYGEYTEDDILAGMLSGSCFNLDKYSAYLTLEDYVDAVDPDQEFCGIGIYSSFNKYTKVYKVSNCFEGGPADRAGLRRGDIIEAIDGYDVYDMELDTVSRLIRGEPGTTVTLKVLRDDELLDIDVVREPVEAPFVTTYQLSNDIGFIQIRNFEGTVSDEFGAALEELGPVKGLIIDLRGNTGGVVDCYRDVMSKLLPTCTIETSVYKDGSRVPVVCESDIKAVGYKIVVLVDGSTASCAESMTQCLVDLVGAKVVGEPTYGKGVFQEYFAVDSDSVLRLTTGYMESPNGVVWNEVGIKPDVEVETEYLGDDFEQAILLDEAPVRAAYDLLGEMLIEEFRAYVKPLS